MISQQVKASAIATFPPGFFLENILELFDDTLLVTVANRKCVYALPPPPVPGQPRQPQLLHQFDDWAMGIATAPNDTRLVYVLTTDFTSLGSKTHSIWCLDWFNVAAAGHPQKLAEFPPGAKALNGLTALSKNVFLAADSFAGCIWRIDIDLDESGSAVGARVTEWMRNSLFDGQLVLPDFQPGANGLKYSSALHLVCFTSTQQRVFGTIAVDPDTWAPVGSPKVILGGPHGPQGDDMILDDDFPGGPVAYLTTHRDNSILRIPLSDNDVGSYDMMAEGTQEDPLLLGPTAGAWKWGHRGRIAYFNADGGLKNPLPGEPPRFGRILQVEFSH